MAQTRTIQEDLEDYGAEEVEPENQWTTFLRFPILYESAVQDSDTNGIGALSDTITCQAHRDSNQFPTLQMTYKLDGIHAKDLKEGRIIMADEGPDFFHQKFRINQVTRTDQNITVNATHIAGDLAYNTIKQDIQVPNATPESLFNLIINNLSDPKSDIRFDTDVNSMANVNMTMADGNVGNLLISPDQIGDTYVQSMVGLFGGEWLFDDYHYYFMQHGGRHTGNVIKYRRNLKTISQDTNIANTYTAGLFYAKYPPAPPKATVENEDWNSIGATYMSGVATVTYAAGGIVDVYDAPVQGHHIIRQLRNGDTVRLGDKISDGATLPDHKVVNTVNGDDWYALEDGGWINSRWVTFDKKSDYLVNNSQGHLTVNIDTAEGKKTEYPIDAVGVVMSNGPYIRVFKDPFLGPDHKPNGETVPKGTPVHFIAKALNQKNDWWYEMSSGRWLYGQHLSFKQEGAYISTPTKGKGYVKKDAQKYTLKHGKAYKAPKHTKMVSARTKRTKKYIMKKIHGKYHTVRNPAYTKQKNKYVKTTIKRGYINLNHGQVEIDGVLYYKTGNGNTLVKASDIDFKKRGTIKPTSVDNFVKEEYANGAVNMYSEPTYNKSMNKTIPAGTSLDTKYHAQGDGDEWTQVTYDGVTGWIPTKYLKNISEQDYDPYNPDDVESSDDTVQANDTDVDQKEITVTLPEGILYSPNSYNEELARVTNVDLSSDFVHDYQDESGLDPSTGEYHMTDADVDQLRRLAQGYMQEQRFGFPNVQLTLTAEQISDIGLDGINLYDYVTVDFEELGINEDAEVTSTTWDCMAHRYIEINVGSLPINYEHLLLSKAKENADQNLAQARSSDHARTDSLMNRWHRVLSLEGSARQEKVNKLMEELGLATVTKDDKGNVNFHPLVSMQTFKNQMNKIDSDVGGIKSWIDSGGDSGVIHAYPNWEAPTELYANSEDGGKLVFNAHGLAYEDTYGNTLRSAISSDGKIYAEAIDAGTISAAHIDSCIINSALSIGNQSTGILISIGTTIPTTESIPPTYGGQAIWLDSTHYHALVSSGRYVTTDGTDEWEYGTNGPEHNGKKMEEELKDWVIKWVGDHIHKTVKVGKTKYPIWYGY